MIIRSKQNSHVKLLRSLTKKKYRQHWSLYMTEGTRAVKEAIKYKDQIDTIYVSQEFFEKNKDLLADYQPIVIEDEIFEDLAQTVESQGILATVRYQVKDIKTIESGRYIMSDKLQDPGNLGGIIRSIDAFDFDGLIIGPGTVDPFNDKVIRSSMGSIHRVDIYEYKELEDIKATGIRLLISDLDQDGKRIYQTDLKEDMIVVIGNEGRGISRDVKDISDGTIYIPMEGQAQSLNANISASIIMYEAMRQRWK